ncbi:hypothetical protein QUF90_15950 [Desulfococcaceae bacterium HSG9]|nr:hypothetical protein [Desulfococcaceae bacterium HSG9]
MSAPSRLDGRNPADENASPSDTGADSLAELSVSVRALRNVKIPGAFAMKISVFAFS